MPMPSRKEILTREVAEKLRLEALFKPSLRRIFARIINEFRIAMARTGKPQEVARYRASFESLLEDQYRRVHKAFGGAILLHNSVETYSELRKKAATPEQEESRIKELIWAIFLLWDEQHAPIQTGFILATTAADMDEAVSQGIQALREEGKPTDQRSVAATAMAILKRILRGRVDLIAVTETQAAAETTKAVEASAVTDTLIPGIPVPPNTFPTSVPKPYPLIPATPPRPLVPVAPTPPTSPITPAEPAITPPAAPINLKKSWITLRDKRVRPTHHDAHGQTRQVNEAFNIGSSRMMYPGDTSLGAPVREIAHCRCSAQYLF
jgi:hypothetical protein